MSQWVRLWEDMPTDPKWRVIARRASQTVTERHCDISISDVVAVFVHMLVNASGWTNWGALDNWNDEVVGAALDIEKESVFAVREAMQGLVLEGNRILNWEKRQTKHADSSAERTAEWRRRKRDVGDNSETVSDGPVTSGDTEEKRREEKRKKERVKSEKNSDSALSPKKMDGRQEEFEKFWSAYGHKQQRRRAEGAFQKALEKASLEGVLEGVKRYHETRPAWQQIALAASWLNGERWNDQTAAPNGHDGQPDRTPEQRWGEYWPQRLDALKAAGRTEQQIEEDKLLRMKSIGVSNG